MSIRRALAISYQCPPPMSGLRLQEWSSCAGSRPDTRGYTCGLWLLMHAVAARMPAEGNSGALWMAGSKGFIKHYFQCRCAHEGWCLGAGNKPPVFDCGACGMRYLAAGCCQQGGHVVLLTGSMLPLILPAATAPSTLWHLPTVRRGSRCRAGRTRCCGPGWPTTR